MNRNRALAFVDSSVLVHAFDKSNSRKRRIAQQLMSELMDQDRLCLSTQVFQEVIVALTRKVRQPCSTEEVMSILDDLAAWPLVIVDYTTMRAVVGLVDRAKVSFWDALIVMSAARSGAKVLYTENLKEGQEIVGVRIVNPFVEC